MYGYGRYVFYLFLVLIVVVYWVGATNEGKVLFSGLTQLSYAVTGRNSQGKFADYPK